ncbi:MAG TPA: alpha/beta fold hydrolase [Verrucomicrobiae bacterium]
MIMLLGVLAASGQSIAGDWQGSLKAGGTALRLLVHFSQAADGAITGTLDSLDQNAPGIRITSGACKAGRITFASQSVGGAFEGRLSADGQAIEGTWSQGQPLPLTLRRAAKSDIAGDWNGTLEAGGQKLRLAFHIAALAGGVYEATLDSLDQGANGIPMSKVTWNSPTLKMESKTINGQFEGKLADGGNAIEGTWNQGQPLPLALKRGAAPPAPPPKRPQNPAKPFPYRQQEVFYSNSAAGIRFAATFTIPNGPGPFPAVLLITGSGPQDRDEAIAGHRPFLVLSDWLTRRGIAVLRADDRGTAKSGGKFAGATTADFEGEAEAGVAYLKSRPEVNPARIGMIGHSEGGTIAPLVASRDSSIAFIVMMAGTGVPGEQIVYEQNIAIAEASGAPHDKAVRNAEQVRAIIRLIQSGKDITEVSQEAREKFPDQAEMVDAQVTALSDPWMRYFLAYDPAPALRRVACPVLVLNGSLDKQVLPAQNLPAIRQALEAGGNRHFEIVEMPGLNHLFQTAKTGSPSEYAKIEETIAPAALEKIASWILAQ